LYIHIILFLLKSDELTAFRFLTCKKWEAREFQQKYSNNDMEADELHPEDVLPEEVIEHGKRTLFNTREDNKMEAEADG